MTKLAEEIVFYSPSNRAWYNSLTPTERDAWIKNMKYRSTHDSADKVVTEVGSKGNLLTSTINDLTGLGRARELRKRIAAYNMSKGEIENFLNKDLSKHYAGDRLTQEKAKQIELKALMKEYQDAREYANKANKSFYANNKDNAELYMTNVAPKKFNEGINNAFKARDIGSAVGAVGTGLLGGLAANWLARRFTKDNKSNWLTNLATIGATLGAGYLGGKYIGDYAGQNAATKAGFGSEYAMQAPNVNRFADNKAVNYFRNLIG